MKYLLIYENGNDYHYGCYRNTWQVHETMDFESEQELKEHIESHNKLYQENKWDNDSKVVKAHLLAGDGNPVFEA